MSNVSITSDDLFPALIMLMAMASAIFLAMKARRKREPIIWSAVLPRLYIGAIYLYFVLFDQDIEFRQTLGRVGFLVLLFVENFNHLLYWINRRHAKS